MRVPRKLIARLVEFVAQRQDVRAADIDIAVVAKDEMAQLNWQYLRHKGATDVLTFDLSEGVSRPSRPPAAEGADRTHGRDAHATTNIEAQIIVCADVAKSQGPRHGLSSRDELLLYVTHGLLHLMGYDDKTAAGAANMQARAEELLREFARQVIIAAGKQTRRPSGVDRERR
jgi:probable rRNA maturation factor